MWADYAAAACVCAILLYVPGYVWSRIFRLSLPYSIAFAPVFSILAYSVEGIILPIIDIDCSWVTIFFPYFALTLIAACLFWYGKRKKASFEKWLSVWEEEAALASGRSTWFAIFLYILVSGMVFGIFYFRHFSDPLLLIQGYDTVAHVGFVRDFLNTENYSSLTVSLYSDVYENGANGPFGSNPAGFYPAGWHILVALAIQLTGADIVIAANAVSIVFCGVVFPISVCSFIAAIFRCEKRYVYAASLLSLAFAAFPWAMLLRGEQLPQMAALSLLPSVLAVALMLFKQGLSRRSRLIIVSLLSLGMLSLVFLHTNGVFSVGLIVIPLGVQKLIEWEPRRFMATVPSILRRTVLVAAFLAIVAIIWFGFYKLPFLQSVVQFTWPATVSKQEALVDALTLSFLSSDIPQIVLALLVYIGLFRCMITIRYRWLVGLYIMVFAMLVVDVSTDGFLKHVLCGFWYTDPDRIKALFSIFVLPLACSGFVVLVDFLGAVVRMSVAPDSLSLVSIWRWSAFFVGLTLCLMIYSPSDLLFPKQATTAFGAITDRWIGLNSEQFPYTLDAEEEDFVEKAEDLLADDDAVVLNIPSDGSSFLYGIDNINLFYRRDEGIGSESETAQSRIIREGLHELQTNPEVADAVRSTGAKYLLLLDYGKEEPKTRFHSYKEDKWMGMESVTENTSGFELLLSEGDMRLYKIKPA